MLTHLLLQPKVEGRVSANQRPQVGGLWLEVASCPPYSSFPCKYHFSPHALMQKRVRKWLKTIGKLLTSLNRHPPTQTYIYKIIICRVIIYNHFITLVTSTKKYSVQYSSVAQSYLTLCDPMNRSTPGLPFHHQLPEFTETHVHPVSDAIQPSHPLLSPSPPAPSPSQHQSPF